MILIKFGGSLITDKTKPYTARLDVIRRLCNEIHEFRSKNNSQLIIGHGGGSFPHTSAHKFQTHLGLINPDSYRGISVVHNDASKLNSIVVQNLIDVGENAISIQPSSTCITKKGKIDKFFLDNVKKFLDYGMIPVPYCDVSIDYEQGCSIISTEEILRYLTTVFPVKKVIMCGIVDGVYEGLPMKSKLVSEINSKNFKSIESSLGASNGTDVTGGMILKVKESLNMAVNGAEVFIINGNTPGNLLKCLNGEKIGTIIKK